MWLPAVIVGSTLSGLGTVVLAAFIRLGRSQPALLFWLYLAGFIGSLIGVATTALDARTVAFGVAGGVMQALGSRAQAHALAAGAVPLVQSVVALNPVIAAALAVVVLGASWDSRWLVMLALAAVGCALSSGVLCSRGGMRGAAWFVPAMISTALFALVGLSLAAASGVSVAGYMVAFYGTAALVSGVGAGRAWREGWPGALVGLMAAGATALRGVALASGPQAVVLPLFSVELAAAALGGVIVLRDRLTAERWAGVVVLAVVAAIGH